MEEKAKKMNLSISKKPICGFCKHKGHTTQQCHRKLEAEYQLLNAIKPKPKEHVVSMNSDGEDGAETNKNIDIEASGTFVPDTIEEDSSGSAMMDIKSNWTSLPRHGPHQEKEDSPLSDISESAFKEWASPLSTRTNHGSTPPKAPTPPPTPPPTPQETDSEDPTSSFPYSDKKTEVDTDSDKENKPPKPLCWTKIHPEWIPYIRRAYQHCEDFKTVAQFPYLFNNEINPIYHVTFNDKTNPNLPTIFKITKNNKLVLCILQNCRRSINEHIYELKETILDNTHTTIGHGSGEKTYQYLRDFYYWPTMHKDTMDFCKQCDTCQHTMLPTQSLYGLAKPLPIPMKPFTHISMDFLSLPSRILEDGSIYDSVWTIVDRFSGYVKIIPVHKSTTSAYLIQKFLCQVYPEWGLPEDIVSDRDARCTSKQWTTFCQHHGIKQSMSTAYHPRTNGQSEVANKAIIQKIKHAMFDGDTNWLERVPFLQAKLNRTFNSSRNATPYEIV